MAIAIYRIWLYLFAYQLFDAIAIYKHKQRLIITKNRAIHPRNTYQELAYCVKSHPHHQSSHEV